MPWISYVDPLMLFIIIGYPFPILVVVAGLVFSCARSLTSTPLFGFFSSREEWVYVRCFFKDFLFLDLSFFAVPFAARFPPHRSVVGVLVSFPP